MRFPPLLLCLAFTASLMPAHANDSPEATPPVAIISRIPREPVTSSALAAVGYSKRLHALEIEFVNGAIYRYLDVPPEVHRDLMAAESKARFYDQNVRRHYHSVHVRPRGG